MSFESFDDMEGVSRRPPSSTSCKTSLAIGHFQAKGGNVGDDLNIWLWPREFNAVNFTPEASTVLIGIGSVLDSRFGHFRQKIVFGAGARGKIGVPIVDDNWDVRFVRGPLTAEALANQVPNVRFITDPAILVANHFGDLATNGRAVGLVPYFRSHRKFWKSLADRCGFEYVCPTLAVEEFVGRLRRCKKVFTESMHGAIIADSLRIPWMPFSSFSRAHEQETHFFKWTDWTSSMNVKFSELALPTVWPESPAGWKVKTKFAIIASTLLAKRRSDFFLSDRLVFESKLSELRSEVLKLSRDLSR